MTEQSKPEVKEEDGALQKTRNQDFLDYMDRTMSGIESHFDSKSFCSAKWLQSTTNLQTGQTHSCHHPVQHKIPIEEVLSNPTAIHNTKHKKEQRKLMLEGKRPSECHYCWNIEDLPGKHFSDRTYKTTDYIWSVNNLNDIVDAGHSGDIIPTYLEVSFENTCNFKCMYCTPDVSSKWMEEVERFGPYPTGQGDLSYIAKVGKTPIPVRENNPYIDAFWKWWPDLYPKLKVFRVTGGEPLLSKNMWRLFDYIIENPRDDLSFAINTNMQPPDELLDRLIEKINLLDGKLKNLTIFTSCEAHGEQANYIRHGMNYEKWLANCRKLLSNTKVDLNIMVTFNGLSVFSFKDFLKDVWTLRTEFNEDDAHNRIPIMISYLRWPDQQGIKLIPKIFKDKHFAEIKEYVMNNMRQTSSNKAGRFYLEELDQINRLIEYSENTFTEETTIELRKHFYRFFNEYDRRKGLDIIKTFPELHEYWDFCKSLSRRRIGE
jgi:pyruvate-formate lyase-activating enzyme